MPRFIPPCPLKAPTAANPWLIERQLEIRLVTPMFGGGVMVGEFDPITPIRASSIRGHLRFWWRLTRGAVCRTPEELREREAEIWGSPENASPVSVEVSHVSQQQERRGPDYDFPKYGSEAYALFSAKQNEVPALCKEGLTFQVRLTWPNQAQLQRLRDRENAGRRA
ncbi:MAG: type III-B CRISPR module RAMP protein Cmr1, partial [Planctomycetes bacterium]|nr:type III-B CRISPR module RAMP protein Cmr1 [Planctomycetota bacterium]